MINKYIYNYFIESTLFGYKFLKNTIIIVLRIIRDGYPLSVKAFSISYNVIYILY